MCKPEPPEGYQQNNKAYHGRKYFQYPGEIIVRRNCRANKAGEKQDDKDVIFSHSINMGIKNGDFSLAAPCELRGLYITAFARHRGCRGLLL